jgi:hypothetical protein
LAPSAPSISAANAVSTSLNDPERISLPEGKCQSVGMSHDIEIIDRFGSFLFADHAAG